MASRFGERLGRVLRAVRDGWLILGVTIVMAISAESIYRLQGSARSLISSRFEPPALASPLMSTDWGAAYLSEYETTFRLGWRSYVYFRRLPFKGQYITVDSLGHRVTPQPASVTGPIGGVLFLGGSTMWGSYQRDDHTIPAEVARRLQATVLPGSGVPPITNLGESGYVFTQELVELMLQLREGVRPRVVVFYDGINDVAATLQNGRAGIPQNESNRAAEFAMGREVNGWDSGFLKDLKSLGVLALAGVQKSELLQRLQAAVRPAGPELIPADVAIASIVNIYAENARIVEALGRTYGFVPLYVWQPSLHTTQKRLTSFEEQLVASIGTDPFQSRLREVHRGVAGLLSARMETIAPGRYVNATGLFAGDSLPVYVDQIGHTTEAGIPRIVDAFWPQLVDALQAGPIE